MLLTTAPEMADLINEILLSILQILKKNNFNSILMTVHHPNSNTSILKFALIIWLTCKLLVIIMLWYDNIIVDVMIEVFNSCNQ